MHTLLKTLESNTDCKVNNPINKKSWFSLLADVLNPYVMSPLQNKKSLSPVYHKKYFC